LPVVEYRPVCAITLAPWEVEAGHGAYTVWVHGGDRIIMRADLGHCNITARVRREDLLALRGERRILYAVEDYIGVAEIRGEGYYKLVPTLPGSWPTLEINGIHMHRVRGADPASDTRAKVVAARIRRGVEVLDTCMGLGYTAIASVQRGAKRVVTVEIDPNVIRLARLNPWSWGLGAPEITLVNDDVVRYVKTLDSESFDRIIHDPPRIMGSTGPLYSVSFYRELYRILRPRGVLYHYTGEPGRKHGANFPGRVKSKLEQVGFRVVKYSRRALGLIAVKD